MAYRYLRKRVTVGLSDTYLVFADTGSLVQIKLDNYISPEALFQSCRSSIEALRLAIGDSSGALQEVLDDAGFTTSEPEGGSGSAPLDGMPLANALRMVREGEPLPSVLIYTAEEAFWPGSLDSTLARRAFRVFVSRQSDATRTALYGALLSDRSTHLLGDEPDHTALLAALETVQKDSLFPQVVELGNGTVTGRVTDSDAIWRGEGGRLSVVSAAQTHLLGTGGKGAPLYWANSYTALPNLSVLPKLGDPGLGEIDFPRVSGVDTSLRMASVKCHAEGVERFASGDLAVDNLRLSAAEDLDGDWLNPMAVVAYNEAQMHRLGVQPFTASAMNWWVRGWTFDGPVWLPAALVYYPFAATPEWLHPSAVSSNGVAAYPDAMEARRRAWVELVERDAFQRARLLGSASGAVRISESLLSDASAEVVHGLARRGQVTILRLSSPTCLAVTLVRVDTEDGISLGLSAGGGEDATIAKAATEAYVQATHPFTHDVDAGEVDSPGDHAALYRRPEWRDRIAWMLDAPLCEELGPACGLPDVPRRVHWVNLLESSELAVVRVIDTTLLPITFGYDSDPTGRPDFAELMLSGGIPLGEPVAPHPFA